MSEPKNKRVLSEFQDFLSSGKLAPEKNIPFYAYWATRFLAFCNKQAAADLPRAALEFQQSLMTDQKIADWQIRQAEEAVRLYLTNFKGVVNPKPTRDEVAGSDEFNAGRLIEETKRLIRLKHYSYSTEHMYIDWINRFFRYIQETKGAEVGRPQREDIKNYLTHLATHLLMSGVNIREIQELLGHKSVETTMIYTHVLRDMKNVPMSALDALYRDNCEREEDTAKRA